MTSFFLPVTLITFPSFLTAKDSLWPHSAVELGVNWGENSCLEPDTHEQSRQPLWSVASKSQKDCAFPKLDPSLAGMLPAITP